MVEREIAAHLAAYRDSGAELIMGTGRFVGPHTIEVSLNGGGSQITGYTTVFLQSPET